MSLNLDDLCVLLGTWPEGSQGDIEERKCIEALDAIGKQIGYGALRGLVIQLHHVQLRGRPDAMAFAKRRRFQELGWPLPRRFEEVVSLKPDALDNARPPE